MAKLKARDLDARNIGSTITYTAGSSGSLYTGRLVLFRRTDSYMELTVEGRGVPDMVRCEALVEVVLPPWAFAMVSAEQAAWNTFETANELVEYIAERDGVKEKLEAAS